MARNFNVKPYYDDFDSTKNYHRILFKPGQAVQARELTQAQTILQDQISKFGNGVFADGSKVTGGNITVDTNAVTVKLNTNTTIQNINITNINNFNFSTINVTDASISIILPNNLRRIGNDTFKDARILSGSLIIPDNVDKIGSSAFKNCIGFNDRLTIGKNVIYIGNNAFDGCNNFKYCKKKRYLKSFFSYQSYKRSLKKQFKLKNTETRIFEISKVQAHRREIGRNRKSVSACNLILETAQK